MVVARDDIAKLLRRSDGPLTVNEIASRLSVEPDECEELLWRNPEEFVWQPGRKWAISNTKAHVAHEGIENAPDVRSHLASSANPGELRALTLSSGLTITVNRRPLDSDAFFTVRSAGNLITLTLNSMHELFANVSMPFEGNRHDSSYKELCEILLSAWALYEDGLPGGATKRAAEDARLLWGRRTIEMLGEREE